MCIFWWSNFEYSSSGLRNFIRAAFKRWQSLLFKTNFSLPFLSVAFDVVSYILKFNCSCHLFAGIPFYYTIRS